MQIKDSDIFTLIEKINDHYKNNINNRFLRKALLMMTISQSTLDRIDGIDDRMSYARHEGFRFQEIYDFILASASFVSSAKKEIAPRLKSLVSGTSVSGRTELKSEGDKILQNMAVSNFSSNLGILADMINELYLKTVATDRKMHENKNCEFEKNPELKNVGQLLIE
ncbi:MAG: hypothetical protein JXR70_01955 [Spirochaetales bacterium]|nr:hypothetical protein [Spirochaetales bacterium]